MASFDLWIDSEYITDESKSWHQEVKMDMDRLHYDEYYATLIDTQVRRALEYLAEEVEQIGIASPPSQCP